MNAREKLILNAIRAHVAQAATSPSYDEISAQTGISKTQVWKNVQALERSGLIALTPSPGRGGRSSALPGQPDMAALRKALSDMIEIFGLNAVAAEVERQTNDRSAIVQRKYANG